MRHNAFSKLFFGLLLIFFNIDIFNLKLITGFIGAVLIATAAWQLAGENGRLKNAYRFSVAELFLQALGLLLLCLNIGGVATGLLTAVAGTICMIGLMYNMFSGLSQMAAEQGLFEFAKKLNKCYAVYIWVAILIPIALIAPPIIIIMIPVTIIAFIYILVQVKRLSDNNLDTPEERALNGRYNIRIFAFIGLTAALCLTILILKSCPPVHTEVYNRNDTQQTDVQSIKTKMLTLGFDNEVLSDLPDSEILNYSEITSVQNMVYHQSSESGTLIITKCVSTFDGGRVRLLFHYKWLEGPRQRYRDKFIVKLPLGRFVAPQDMNFNGFALYEKQSYNGTTTYKAGFVKRAVSGTNGYIYAEIDYRVLGKEALNQRGFFAFDTQLAMPTQELNYNTIIDYYHQRSIFYFEKIDKSNNNQMIPAYSQSYAFERFQFLFEDKYKP